MAYQKVEGKLTAEGLSFGIVVSRWNDFLTKPLLEGAIDALVRHGAMGNPDQYHLPRSKGISRQLRCVKGVWLSDQKSRIKGSGSR